MNLLSVWAGGLWVVPLLPFIGTIIFGYKAYKASKSNSTQDLGGIGGIKDNTGNVPIYKTGYFVLAVGCLIAVIAIIGWVYSEK